MSEPTTAQCLGDQATFSWGGKEWTLVPWDRYGIQKAYEVWLKRRAADAARDMARWFGEDGETQAAVDAYSALQRDTAAGVYGWGGDVWAKSLSTQDGVEKVTLLSLQVTHGADVDLEMVRKMLREDGKHVAELMKDLTTDPNPPPPGAAPSAVTRSSPGSSTATN